MAVVKNDCASGRGCSMFFLNGVGMTGFKTKQGPRSLQRCRPSDSSTGMCVCASREIYRRGWRRRLTKNLGIPNSEFYQEMSLVLQS